MPARARVAVLGTAEQRTGIKMRIKRKKSGTAVPLFNLIFYLLLDMRKSSQHLAV